ncbi:MAG TPA: hypothetical protein VMT03_12590 [Polyangia bacterium]|nr:hypothetical protein [Polyangia bacterium]
MRRSGDALVESFGITRGLKVLDLGCGDGTTALPAARRTFTFDTLGPPGDFLATFRDYYGPTMNAFGAAAQNGRAAELQAELEALFAAQNQRGRPDQTSIPATFLRVTVTV